MDLRMPDVDGVTAIAELSERANPARVLVLTTYQTDSDVVSAMRAGATGYLLKDAPRAELFRAVRAAHRGDSVLAPSVAARLVTQLRAPAQDTLSEREVEVLVAADIVAQANGRSMPTIVRQTSTPSLLCCLLSAGRFHRRFRALL